MREYALRVLLDQQDGHALRADRSEQRIDLIDHHRGEAERRLVEHEKPRPRQQRPGDGELLLLAAGKLPGRLTPPLREDRKLAKKRSRSAATARLSRRTVAPSRRFSITVRLAKMCRPSGTSAMPWATTSSERDSAERAAGEDHGARGGSDDARPRPRCSEVLPAPFGPTMLTISPSSTCRSTSRTAVTAP